MSQVKVPQVPSPAANLWVQWVLSNTDAIKSFHKWADETEDSIRNRIVKSVKDGPNHNHETQRLVGQLDAIQAIRLALVLDERERVDKERATM